LHGVFQSGPRKFIALLGVMNLHSFLFQHYGCCIFPNYMLKDLFNLQTLQNCGALSYVLFHLNDFGTFYNIHRLCKWYCAMFITPRVFSSVNIHIYNRHTFHCCSNYL
jgi:hypothetical protein